MKALTIWQPWAELIILGHKTMETRGWKPYYSDRRIAIHAAAYKRLPHEIYMEIAAAIGIPPERYNGSWLYYIEHRIPAESFGAVIGTATIGRVLTSSEAVKVISLKEMALGDYSPRRYAWELTDVQAFEKPIPARGQQGLWEWDGSEGGAAK